MKKHGNAIFDEMLLDLEYRLRLADALFGQATEAVMSAMGLDDFPTKRQASAQVNACAMALRILQVDFTRLLDSQAAACPPEIPLWLWNEPEGEATLTQTLERLRDIAEGMRTAVLNELQREVKP